MIKRLLFISALAATSVLHSCSENSARQKAAQKRGIADANSFIELSNTTKISQMKLQSFLLDVRHKEYQLIQARETEAAKLYITSFEKHLRDSVPDLFIQISPQN